MLFGKSTKIYAVYMKPDDAYPHETVEFVEEHASIWGFVFHILWCLYHKLWLHGVVLMVIWGAVIAMAEVLGLSILTVFAVELVIRILVAFDGNSWRQAQLLRQGYILSDVVTGESELAAKQRFFDRWLKSAA